MNFIKSIIAFFQNKDAIAIMKDLVNILFFITTGTVTVLTYIKAKGSILQPIKTEVFKQQLAVFSEIMEMFNAKSEEEIIDFFALNELVCANIVKLVDDYAHHFFDIDIEREKRPYCDEKCPYIQMSKESSEKYVEIITEPVREEIAAEQENINKPDPETKAAIWQQYKYEIIYIPLKYMEAMKKIDKIIKSPLLPEAGVHYLKEIKNAADDNIIILNQVLNDVAQELPEKYPNRKVLAKASIIWIENIYGRKAISFEKQTRDLTNYIRDYLGTDKLLK